MTLEGSKPGFPIEDQALFDQRTKYSLKVKKLTENDGAWFDHESDSEVVNGSSSSNSIFLWIATYRGEERHGVLRGW